MQVIDNLLVVHNMERKSSQLYDLKLADYNTPILSNDSSYPVSTRFARMEPLVYMSDLLLAEERRSPDETCYSKPV